MLEIVGTIIFLLIVLVKSADIIEDAFVAIAEKFNINTFLTGFIILAFTSSLPEASVAINSILEDAVSLSIGNVLGATTIILTLIIGLNAIKHGGMPFKGFFGRKEVVLALGVILSQVAILIDGNINPIEGIILITLYLTFITYIIYKSNKQKRRIPPKRKVKQHSFPVLVVRSAIGVIGLLWSANLIVDNALILASALEIPRILVGLFMLSLGTNLPEIALLLRSDSEQKIKLAAGNFIGSATLNTFILGALAIASPYTLPNLSAIIPVLIILTVTVVVFANMVTNDEEITAKEGYFLLTLFFTIALVELFMSAHL